MSETKLRIAQLEQDAIRDCECAKISITDENPTLAIASLEEAIEKLEKIQKYLDLINKVK